MQDTEQMTYVRVRTRSHFLVRWDAVITVIVASLVSFSIGMAVQYQIMSSLILR